MTPGYGKVQTRQPVNIAGPSGSQPNPYNIPVVQGHIPVPLQGFGGGGGGGGFGSRGGGGRGGASGAAQISAGNAPSAGGTPGLAGIGGVQGLTSQLGGAGTNVMYGPNQFDYGAAIGLAARNVEQNQRGFAQGQLASQLKAQEDALRSQVVQRPVAGGGGGGGVGYSDPSGVGNIGSNLGGAYGGGGGGGGGGSRSGGGGGGYGGSFGGGTGFYGFGVFDAGSQYPGGSGSTQPYDQATQGPQQPLLGTTPLQGTVLPGSKIQELEENKQEIDTGKTGYVKSFRQYVEEHPEVKSLPQLQQMYHKEVLTPLGYS